MSKGAWKGFARTAGVLLIVGLALWGVTSRGRSAGGMTAVADILFAQASVFLAWGIVRMLVNMRMFASFSWGMKMIKKLFRGRQMGSGEMKDGFLKYRDAQPHHDDVPLLIGSAAALGILSVLAALLA